MPTVPGLVLAARAHGLPASAIGLLTVLLFAWPVLDGGDPHGAGAAHLALQLLAGTAAAGACLLAGVSAGDRARLAWSLLALTATVLTCAQAVTAGSVALPGDRGVTTAQAGLAVAGIAALLLLSPAWPSTGRAARIVDAALAVVGVALLVWVVAAGSPTQSLRGAEAAALASAAALVGTCLLVLVRTSVRRMSVQVSLAVGLGLFASAVLTGVVAQAWSLPDLARPVGAGSFAGMLLIAVAAATAGRSGVAVPAATDTAVDVLPARAASVALSVPPVVAVVALAVGALAGRPARALPTLLLALVVLLSWLRLQLLAADGRASLARLAEDEQRMRHQAFHDTLTGLANRQLFHDRLDHALAVHRRSHRPLALLFGDLDGFKKVNDEHGHDAGDLVLRTVAERMSACLRPTDTLARLGGDEFAVLLDDGDQPEIVVERLVSCVAEGVSLPRGTAVVHLSLGVALVAGDDPTPTVAGLLAEADAAMYVAKRGARGARDVTPHSAMTIDPVAPLPATSADDGRAVMLSALARDLSTGRLEVVYQPLVEPVTGTVVGVEALARWRFAGIDVPPPAFVELAEQAGLGSALTDVVLDRAAGQLRRWSASAGHDRLTLSVNLTAGELDDDTLPARVAEVVTRHGLQPGQLVLETPAAAVRDGQLWGRLSAAGAVLSLVSTAESPVALTCLHDLPLGGMKIAGRPVGGDDGTAETQVRLLRAIGRELDLRIVVERVESNEQLAVVRRLGGLLAQGFLLARPAPASEIEVIVLHGCPVPA